MPSTESTHTDDVLGPRDRENRHPARKRARLAIVLGAVLFVYWLVLSGHYTAWLMISGASSSILVALLCLRMKIIDEECVPFHFSLRMLGYALWLVKEIVLANIDVARRVLNPRLPVRPTVFRLKASQKTDLARVIYANSITLTPGTVSVDIQGDEITVHSLTLEAAAEDKSGEMDRRVSQIEATA